MNIMNIINTTNIFKYGSFAHGSMVIIYYLFNENLINLRKPGNLNKNIFSVVFLLGHFFIFSAIYLRIFPVNRGQKYTTIVGSIGHTCLLLFFISFFLQTNFDYKITINNMSIIYLLGIIGQIGMITVYFDEYKYYNITIPKNIMFKNMCVFIIVCFLYLFMAINKNNIIFFPLLFIAILYILFFINQYQVYNLEKSKKLIK